MNRPSPQTLFEWFDRSGRPALRWAGVAVVALWGMALVIAAFRSALTGVSMPDMTGGIVPLLVGLGPTIMDLVTRHREIMAGGARGPGAEAGAT